MIKFIKKYWRTIVSIILAILMIVSGIFSILSNTNNAMSRILSYASLFFAILCISVLSWIVASKNSEIKEKSFIADFFSALGFAFFTTAIFDFYVYNNKELKLFLLMGLGFLYLLISYISKQKN